MVDVFPSLSYPVVGRNAATTLGAFGAEASVDNKICQSNVEEMCYICYINKILKTNNKRAEFGVLFVDITNVISVKLCSKLRIYQI